MLHLLDERWQGIAKGVGQSRILGRVHQAPVKVGDKHLRCAITVLEQDDMEFLFGLDNLRRYQCNIDLQVRGSNPTQTTKRRKEKSF